MTQNKIGRNARTIIVFPGSLGPITHQPTDRERGRLSEVFERLWYINDPEFLSITQNCPSRDDAVAGGIRGNSRAEMLFSKARAATAPRHVAEVAQMLHASEMPHQARRACRTLANTSVGNAGESPALAAYAEENNATVRQPRHRFSMISLIRKEKYLVEIRGRIDGIVLKNDPKPPGLYPSEPVLNEELWRGGAVETVVEVKTRTRCLFGNIAQNERVQLEMYLQMLDAGHGVLVERLGKKMRTHHYVRDDKFYQTTMESLERFANVFVDFLGNYSARVRYTQLQEYNRISAVCSLVGGTWPSYWLGPRQS